MGTQELIPATGELDSEDEKCNGNKIRIHLGQTWNLANQDSGRISPVEAFTTSRQFSNFPTSPSPFRLPLYRSALSEFWRRSASFCQKRPNVTRLVCIVYLLYYLMLCIYISFSRQYAPILSTARWSSRAVTYSPTATQTTAEAA